MRWLAKALPAVFLLAPMVAHADQYFYAASNNQPGHEFNFTYVSDHRIDRDTVVTPTTCTVLGQGCESVRFVLQVADGSPGSAEAFLDITGANGLGASVDSINPDFFLHATDGLDPVIDNSVIALWKVPDSVPYFYFYLDNSNEGGSLTFYSPELITSRTTVPTFAALVT